MPHVVVRLYTESGPLIGAIREREAEVREIMLGVDGFRAYTLVDTGTGALSVTACDDQAGTDASIAAAAEWIRANLPDARIAPPEILQGEGMFRIEGPVSDESSHVILRVFDGPPPTGYRELEPNMREVLANAPGFRSYSAIDCGTQGVTIIAADDKASADECSRRIREYGQTVPAIVEAARGRTPRVIEGERVLRFTAQAAPV